MLPNRISRMGSLLLANARPLLQIYLPVVSGPLSRGFKCEGDFASSVDLADLPKDLKHIELPEMRKLPNVDKVPQYPTHQKNPYSKKKLYQIRGPEMVHNKLLYQQYGIIALSGVQFRIGHFDAIRLTVNRMIDDTRMFALWRVDPPWKPRTKRSIGKTLGGGKGSIDHYVSPIKAGRVIIEMGGRAEFKEIEPILQQVLYKLPCDAIIVSQAILDKIHQEEIMLQKKNINPFSFKYVVDNNMQGCHRWTSPYDSKYYNEYI